MYKLLLLENFTVYIDDIQDTSLLKKERFIEFMTKTISGEHTSLVEPMTLKIKLEMLLLNVVVYFPPHPPHHQKGFNIDTTSIP